MAKVSQPTSAAIATWAQLENEIAGILAKHARYASLLYSRVYDTRAAGNFLPKQPADFYVLCEGRFRYIEAKFSETLETLKQGLSSMVKPHQLATATLTKRAGGEYYIIFFSTKGGQFEVWDGAYCAQRKLVRKHLELPARSLVTSSLEEAVVFCLNPREAKE